MKNFLIVLTRQLLFERVPTKNGIERLQKVFQPKQKRAKKKKQVCQQPQQHITP
jgi:hypothetical protein